MSELKTRQQWAQEYTDLGWSLCATRTDNNKAPIGQGWQKKGREPGYWADNTGAGMGIVHGLSGTCALDLDDLKHAKTALAAVGINLDKLLSQGVQIHSGKDNSGKLLYKVPDEYRGSDWLKRHNLNWPDVGCVLELRAGPVHDVLPPSVHPETGTVYEWQGDWQNLPPLPDKMIRVWREWKLAKEAMLDACPWADRTPARVPANVQPAIPVGKARKSGNVIGKFNRAHSVGEILERHGYRAAGRRWLAPNSGTGIPGVVLLPNDDDGVERVFSFHGSCPLCDDHSHDAFSVYCHIEHGGNIEAAVRTAADLMGIEAPMDEEGARIAKRIMQNAKQEPPTNNVVEIKPKPPLKGDEVESPDPGPIPSSMLQRVRSYIERSCSAYREDAVTQAVLTFAGHQTGRRYQTFDGQPTCIFAGAVDSSAVTMRPLKGATYRLTAAFGTDERTSIRGTHITGASVVYNHLAQNARMLWISDEYGYMVQQHRRQTSGALAGALGLLMEVYTGDTLFIDRDTTTTVRQKDIKELDIYAPSVSVMALLSEDHVTSMSQRSEYGRGTLQQMLLIPAGQMHYTEAVKRGQELPAGLVDWQKRLSDIPGIPHAEESPYQMPHMHTVPLDDGILKLIGARRQSLMEYMSADEKRPWRGMVHGYIQSAIRIMASLAAWNDPESPIVGVTEASWSLDWVERCLRRIMPLIEISSPSGDPDVMQRVMETLMRKGKPMSDSELRRACADYKRLKEEDRIDLMRRLSEVGMVREERTEAGAAGRPTTRWVASKIIT